MQTHTVKTGDTLWTLARRYLGAGARWGELWSLNQTAIESAGRDPRYRGPDWLYPGTVLRIPEVGTPG